MKKFLTATALVALVSGAALAQSTMSPSAPSTSPSTPSPSMSAPAPAPTTATPSTTAASSINFVTQQESSQWMVSDIIGASVYGPDNKSIGEIDDLVSGSDGKVTAAVIGVGGFLGMGQKMVAVSFDSIQKSKDEKGSPKLTLSATVDQLKSAPDFKTQADMNRTASSASPATSRPVAAPNPATAPK